MLARIASTLLVAAAAARAAMYPTMPVRSTWYTLDVEKRDIDLRWRDTSDEPHTDALGMVRVQLLFDEDVVTDLTPHIDASAREATVRVPRDVAVSSGSKYYIRFIPHDRDLPSAYTAYFTIVNSTAPDVSPEAIEHARSQMSASQHSSSTLSFSSTSTALVTPTTASPVQDAIGTAVNAARATRMRGASIRGKLMFMVWPLLIGCALAL